MSSYIRLFHECQLFHHHRKHCSTGRGRFDLLKVLALGESCHIGNVIISTKNVDGPTLNRNKAHRFDKT